MSDSERPSTDIPAPGADSYTCPGELYSIPRAIHLARLAAYYHKCRGCEHRRDVGHFTAHEVEPPDEQKPPDKTVAEVHHTSLVTEECVRGTYLNELDRNRALLWGEALAAHLWDQQPMIARKKFIDTSQIVFEPDKAATRSTQGPIVVVGFDERPSSPAIVSGAVLGLRRMGCPVVDLGQTGMPAMAYCVQSIGAAAGLFVTGAGCDSSATGFEFLSPGGMPFSHDNLLKLEHSVQTGVGRQTRQIGTHQPHHGQSAYESSLESHFHALRPLRIVCGSPTRLLTRTLDRLFAKLPCSITHVALPLRRRDLFDSRDVDLQRVAAAVVEGQHHLGVIIDEDGRHVALITDRGRLVGIREIARILVEVVQRDHPLAKFVVATSWLDDVKRWLNHRQAKAIDGGESISTQVQKLIEHEALLALSADGRVWFHHSYPACDALLVIAHVLQALSLSDAPFSEVVARIASDLEKSASTE